MYHAPKVVLITDFLLAAWVVFWVIGLLGGSGVGKTRVWVMIVWPPRYRVGGSVERMGGRVECACCPFDVE